MKRETGSLIARPKSASRIPKGFHLSAQGCGAAATLGALIIYAINPERVEISAHDDIVSQMSQSLAKVLVHAVFSTKHRQPFLNDTGLRSETHHYIGGILANLDCQPLIVGGVEDQSHFLCALARTCDAASMIKEVKRGSSVWIKTKGLAFSDFHWQNGYGVFSIGCSQIPAVKQYIENQAEHHYRKTFQDEYRELLQRYEIEYDERYVWD